MSQDKLNKWTNLGSGAQHVGHQGMNNGLIFKENKELLPRHWTLLLLQLSFNYLTVVLNLMQYTFTLKSGLHALKQQVHGDKLTVLRAHNHKLLISVSGRSRGQT